MAAPAKDYLEFEQYYELVTKFGEQAVQKAAENLANDAASKPAMSSRVVQDAFMHAHHEALQKANLDSVRNILDPHFEPKAHAKPELTLNPQLRKGIAQQFKAHPALDQDVAASIATVYNDFIADPANKDLTNVQARQELTNRLLNQYKMKASPKMGSHKKKLEQEYTPSIKLTR